MAVFDVGGKTVGDGQPVFIVAECGINHNGELRTAIEMIDAAAAAGADAVKFQLFRAAGMYTPRAGKYKTAKGEMVPIYALMEEVELPLEWLPELSAACRRSDIKFIMTVCDEWCVRAMEQADFDAYKVASYEISHVPMLIELARHDKPIIISSGAANISDVVRALEWLSPEGARPIGTLQCEAQYPADPKSLNLNVIETYRRLFPNVIPGFSDHTSDPVEAPVQSVYHGARIVEKHITLDRSQPGADHIFALEPAQLAQMVSAIREAEAELAAGVEPQIDNVLAGDGVRRMAENEKMLRDFAYRGIFAIASIKAGEILTEDNIRVLRPGELAQGMHPRYFPLLSSGRYRATRDIERWTGLDWDDVLVAVR